MPWMGGKGQLMWAIQMLLPIHYKTLVDVLGGSGIITLNTAVPKGCLQIYNDLNHDLYNLLFCVKHQMCIRDSRMTDTGLSEINESESVYTDSVKRGYSDCTMRISYAATPVSYTHLDVYKRQS